MSNSSNGSGPDPNAALSTLCRLLAAHVAEIDTTLRTSGAQSTEALTEALAQVRALTPEGGAAENNEGAEALEVIEDHLLNVGNILQMHDILRQYHELVQHAAEALAEHFADGDAEAAEELEPLFWQLCHSKTQRNIHREHFPHRQGEKERPTIQLF